MSLVVRSEESLPFPQATGPEIVRKKFLFNKTEGWKTLLGYSCNVKGCLLLLMKKVISPLRTR